MSEEQKSLTFYERGPGPGAYGFPPLVGFKNHGITHKQDPAYSIKERLQYPYDIPGPGAGRYYMYDGINHHGTKPQIAFTMRKKLPIKIDTPGPGPSLNPKIVSVKPRVPTFTMRQKPKVSDDTIGPGSGAYNLPQTLGPRIPDKLAAPEITQKGRWRAPTLDDEPRKTYFLPQPVSTKKHRILEKWRTGREIHKAGPASYNPYRMKCPGVPSWKFGLKHGDFTSFFRTPCDAVNWADVPNW